MLAHASGLATCDAIQESISRVSFDDGASQLVSCACCLPNRFAVHQVLVLLVSQEPAARRRAPATYPTCEEPDAYLWYAKSQGRGYAALFGTVHIASEYVRPLIRVLVHLACAPADE